MKSSSVTLQQMLDARERRAWIQRDMLERAGNATHNPESQGNTTHSESQSNYCLVCLTLNIAGEIKRTPMTYMLFAEGVHILEQRALEKTWEILDRRMIHEVTGDEAFWLIGWDGRKVKGFLELVEDSFPAARLFDFDVLLPDGTKLSRDISRKCLVCGNPVTECSRSRRHGLDAVKAATDELLREFCADAISAAAYSSLLDELYTTPKPGLVDLANTGAHDDMDVPLFELSAKSLRPYFRDAVLLGMKGCDMAGLRSRGLEAENDMFSSTGGINTHKGMIYSMGLLAAGMGKALASGHYSYDQTDADAAANEDNRSESMTPGSLTALAVRFASEYAREDAEILLARSEVDPVTNGGKVLQNYGARGAMGEAAGGFQDAIYCFDRLTYYNEFIVNNSDNNSDNISISAFHDSEYPFYNLKSGEESNLNDSISTSVSMIRNVPGVLAFCDSMARLEDTNLLHRGGEEGLRFAREEAMRISALPIDQRISELALLDKEMIRRNLSPGGSADMLALAYFLKRLEIV